MFVFWNCRRLEALQRSLQWARGRWVNASSADRTLTDLAELMDLLRSSPDSDQQGILSSPCEITYPFNVFDIYIFDVVIGSYFTAYICIFHATFIKPVTCI